MSKHLFVALAVAAGLAGCESGDKDRGRSTSAATTTGTTPAARPGYQTATARDMQQGWVPGRPPSATTSTTLARAEAETGRSVGTGFTVRPATYSGPQARMTTTAAGAPATPISGDAFVREALAGDIFEVESSRLALERASDERIREFAQMMVDDHSGAHDRLMQAAEVQGIDVPYGPTQRQIAKLDRLATLQGEQFDREYSQGQVDSHQAFVVLHENFLRTGRNPQLQAQAEERLPMLRGHLEQIRPLAEELDPTLLRNGQMNGDMNGQAPRNRPASFERPRGRTGELPEPMRRDTPGMTPGHQPGRPTGPDQPQNQPPAEPDPR